MHTFKLAQIRQKPKSSKSNADYANEWANEESDSIYFVNQTKMNQTHIANDEEKKKYINSMLLFQCGCKSDALFVCLLIWMYFFINFLLLLCLHSFLNSLPLHFFVLHFISFPVLSFFCYSPISSMVPIEKTMHTHTYIHNFLHPQNALRRILYNLKLHF